MAAATQTGVNHEDGMNIGKASTDLVGFHGTTPCDQAAAVTCASTSAAVSVCGSFAFTSAQANALITNTNAIISALKEKGLMASS